MLLSPFSVLSSSREGTLKGSLKRQVACLKIISFFFEYFFGAGLCPVFLKISRFSVQDPGGGENFHQRYFTGFLNPLQWFLLGVIIAFFKG